MRWADLTETQVDQILLLLARGASTAQAAEQVGLSGRTVERRLLTELPDAYRAALEARHFTARNHGTRACYNAGCRCQECTESLRRYMAAKRGNSAPPVHGTVSAYRNHGCRCDQCRLAGAEANQVTRAKIRAGEYEVGHGTSARVELELGCTCPACDHERERLLAHQRERNNKTRLAAIRSGNQWTGPELQTALERDQDGNWMRSTREVATLLGRSYYAVVAKRSQESDPRVGLTGGAGAR